VPLAAGLGVLAAACSSAPTAPTSTSAPVATTAARATSVSATSPTSAPAAASTSAGGSGKKAAQQVLTVRQYDEPGGFDPAKLFRIETENIAFNIYSGLTSFDPQTGEPVPDLAKSWQISPDATTYTFNLVDNAYWHQEFGKLTAQDVKYSYERVLDPATGSPYRAEFTNVASIDAPSAETVVIQLKQPDANFLYQVGSYHQGQVVKKEAIEKYGDQYPRHPVGTGPFELKEWIANSHMILEAHPGYFRGKPTLSRIRLNLIKDVEAAATALSNGEVDLAMQISGGSAEALERVMNAGRFTLQKSEDYGVNLWILNPDYAPLADVRVRRAMAHALDNESITKKLLPHTGKPHNSILPKFMPVYAENLPTYPYDPEKAKALLREAGYANGFAVSQILTSTAGVTTDSLMRQAMLAEVGIKLNFELMETSIWNKRRNSGDYQMTTRLYPSVNPDTLLFGYLHPENIVPKGLNGSKYDNPTLTAELEAARAELNPELRKKHYTEVQRIAQTDLPYIPYQSNSVYWAGYPWVKNVVVDKLAVVNYFPVYVEEH
jgi:peptide/nickel transport system substrate-binding protein